MRKKPMIAASAVLALSATPATAATFFDIDAAHPSTLSIYGRYIRFSFSAQVVSPDGSTPVTATFTAEPGYVRNGTGTYQARAPLGGTITSSEPTSFSDVAYYMSQDVDYSRNLFSFSTSSNQTIRIIDFTAISDEAHQLPSILAVTFLPEPGTWLMMLTGFAMTGYALRSKPKVKLAFN